MDQINDILPLFIALLVPLLGWIVQVISKLNATLTTLDKNIALSDGVIANLVKDAENQLRKMDRLEIDVAGIKGTCIAQHHRRETDDR